MSAVNYVSKNSESLKDKQALAMNISAAKGLQAVLETNLGPRGSMKMLVSGGGDIKLTKDGHVLIKEMQIQHPTAALIAKTAASQDQVTGDGTTSSVLLIGELLKKSETFLVDNLHPRVLADGFDLAKERVLEYIEKVKIEIDGDDLDFLSQVAFTSLSTKIHTGLAKNLTSVVVDAVKTIQRPEESIDLHMIEIMAMQHHSDVDTRLVKGLVLDHGARNPDMPRSLTNVYILTINVSLEAEKPLNNIVVGYKDASGREEFVKVERKFVDDRVKKIIALKNEVCKEGKTFVVINQKGIDPGSLAMLADEGILALRRAKRRNMERLSRACGGIAVNSVEDLSPQNLGYAEKVYQHVLGEERYTFIEGVENPFSCTVLMKGPNKHTILQIKDALRDGIRSVKNCIEDGCVLPGAGAFEMGARLDLLEYQNTITNKMKIGVQVFADALLVIPKTLAVNSGFDVLDTILELENQHKQGNVVGIDINTGETIDPTVNGIYDNYRVKRHLMHSSPVIATQLLLVDEVLRSGGQ
eukprot:TRINITY_DN12143_c0_g1_i1.p1 TRINITY_DN12143_c0_g1~~TRINITY_DN12143_c0_g1_i1.p1  ORF type:complete len:551 (-),score=137.66 TRINITY_DN12143_c0_g1_i1:31-1611(-)